MERTVRASSANRSRFGTVTVSKPFSIEARISSGLAFSGSRRRRRKLPLRHSTWRHVPPLDTSSSFLSPLIRSTPPSSTSTLTSSFLTPGSSAKNKWASGVSRQSTCAQASAAVPTSLPTSRWCQFPRPRSHRSKGSYGQVLVNGSQRLKGSAYDQSPRRAPLHGIMLAIWTFSCDHRCILAFLIDLVSRCREYTSVR
ncbi:hypothetical protein HPP92_027719 [Vanilla planifolia]|uniref:Uncharacterized protein n=1 Tax=Vanilla planifolia TaxID=51239 RepID=A0A835PDV0_VANPL|nr:hypothetical protein HPP92_027719 [Vanilla planifolia]